MASSWEFWQIVKIYVLERSTLILLGISEFPLLFWSVCFPLSYDI